MLQPGHRPHYFIALDKGNIQTIFGGFFWGGGGGFCTKTYLLDTPLLHFSPLTLSCKGIIDNFEIVSLYFDLGNTVLNLIKKQEGHDGPVTLT